LKDETRRQFLNDLRAADEDRCYFIFVNLPANAVWVAEMDDRIAGFITFAEGWVNHLYATLRHALFCETVGRCRRPWRSTRGRKFYPYGQWPLLPIFLRTGFWALRRRSRFEAAVRRYGYQGRG
jgi:hypothetical protein